MAVTILGGEVLCLPPTLLITPIVYSYFDDLKEMDWMAFLRRMPRARKEQSATPADI